MKPLIHFFLFCLAIAQLTACKKEATLPTNSLPVTAGNITGTFTVGSFVHNGNAATTFSGFSFEFTTSGTIVAVHDSTTFKGTWVFDDGNNTEIKMYFSEAPLNQLNQSWHISSLTTDHLLLSDDNKNEDAQDDHGRDNSSIEFKRD